MKSSVCLFMAILSCLFICCRKNHVDNKNAADSDIAWKKTWGSANQETTNFMAVATDGGIVITGASSDPVTFQFYGWMVNFDSQGNQQWEASNDGAYSAATSVAATPDGGYVYTDVSALQTDNKDHIVKLDSRGEILWENYFEGDSLSHSIRAIAPTSDGGYVVAGAAYIIDNVINGVNYWIAKLNGNGEKEWHKNFGEADGVYSHSYSTGAASVAATPDGGYVLVGSNMTTIDTYYRGNSDFMIIKLDSHGEIQWKKSFGGSEQDEATSVALTDDGNYIVAGSAASQDGDVQGVKIGASNYYDVWVMELDKMGQMLWQKTLGGWENDKAASVVASKNGGCIVAGTTSSNSGDVKGNHGYSDCWVVELDGRGDLIWQKALGGFNDDEGIAVGVSPNGGCIMAGTTWSNDGDATGNNGLSDAFIVEIKR